MSTVPLKQCNRKEKCINPLGSLLPNTSEYFHCEKAQKDGLTRKCKVCACATSRQWVKDNPERAKEKHHNYNLTHKDERRHQFLERRESDPAWWEKQIARLKEWDKNHPEEVRASQKKYEDEHWYEIRIKSRQRSRNTPLRGRTNTQNRRARLSKVEGIFSLTDWQNCLTYWSNRCAVCGKKEDFWTALAQDHWIPIAKGGRNDLSNLVPLCHAKKDVPKGHLCYNNSKGKKTAEDWLVRRFGEKKTAIIIKRVNSYFASVTQNMEVK